MLLGDGVKAGGSVIGISDDSAFFSVPGGAVGLVAGATSGAASAVEGLSV